MLIYDRQTSRVAGVGVYVHGFATWFVSAHCTQCLRHLGCTVRGFGYGIGVAYMVCHLLVLDIRCCRRCTTRWTVAIGSVIVVAELSARMDTICVPSWSRWFLVTVPNWKPNELSQ